MVPLPASTFDEILLGLSDAWKTPALASACTSSLSSEQQWHLMHQMANGAIGWVGRLLSPWARICSKKRTTRAQIYSHCQASRGFRWPPQDARLTTVDSWRRALGGLSSWILITGGGWHLDPRRFPLGSKLVLAVLHLCLCSSIDGAKPRPGVPC